jgi:hypothetical protein
MSRILQVTLAVAWIAWFSGDAMAQQVIARPPLDFSGISPQLITTGTNQPGALLPPEAPVGEDQPLYTLGPLRFRPHLMYRLLYGDGVPARPGEDYETAINEIYPGILIGIGNHWNLDYTPTLRYYSSSRFRDTLNHTVTLAGGTVYQDWTLGFSQNYVSTSEPLIETGGQTDEESFATRLNATYQISTPLSLELGASQSFRYMGESETTQELSDSKNWNTLDWLNYQFSPRIGAALGLGFAYDYIQVGSDMTSEQLQGRVTWRPGQKLFLTASAGLEYRQFLDSDESAALNPLFGLSALYQIFEPTSLSVGMNRTVSASYFGDQYTEVMAVSASLRQRLLNKLFLDLSGGFTRTAYNATTTSVAVNRDDNGTFFNARLSMEVLRRGTVAVFYQRTENNSNEEAFALSSAQVGVELGYRF